MGRASALALMLFGFLCLLTDGSRSDPIADERVRAGDVVVTLTKNDQGVHGLRGRFLVRASRSAIWRMLTDYRRFRELYENLDEVQVLEETAERAVVKYRIRVAWMRYEYVLSRRYDDPGRRLTWRLIEGDLRVVSGAWHVHDAADANHHVLEYESYVDVGFFVPTKVVADRAAAEFTKTAERIRAQLRGLE